MLKCKGGSSSTGAIQTATPLVQQPWTILHQDFNLCFKGLPIPGNNAFV